MKKNIFVIVRPPFLYLLFLLIGANLHILLPLSIVKDNRIAVIIGVSALIISTLLFIWAAKTMFSSNVNPDFKPVSRIVFSGPFAYTRNPMYVAFTLFYIGISVVLNTWWPLFILPILLLIMRYYIIQHEEQYLASLFGKEYHIYSIRVRRWL